MNSMTRIALVGILVVATAAYAATDPTAKCKALKLKAAGQKTLGKVKCHQKALLKALPVDPVCLGKVETKFSAGIAKGDAAGTCPGTATSLEAAVDAALASYLALVDLTCNAGETLCLA